MERNKGEDNNCREDSETLKCCMSENVTLRMFSTFSIVRENTCLLAKYL